MKPDDPLGRVAERLRKFASDRDWNKFHSPKNLATALSVEASEVLEHFQWLTHEESQSISTIDKDNFSLELADVFLYLIRLADILEIDLMDSADRKIDLNSEKYPVALAHGSARKYTKL